MSVRPLLLSALLLAPTSALAGVVPTTPAPQPAATLSIDVSVAFPRVEQTTTVLVGLIALGTAVAFLNAGGTVVATVSTSGTVVPVRGMDPSTAVNVSVATQQSGIVVRETYPLVTKLPKGGQTKVAALNVRGKTQMIPLVAVMKRQSDKVHAQKKAQGAAKGQKGNGHGKGH